MFAHTTPIRKVLRGEEEDMNFEFGIHRHQSRETQGAPDGTSVVRLGF